MTARPLKTAGQSRLDGWRRIHRTHSERSQTEV